jgi:hypothetical protein
MVFDRMPVDCWTLWVWDPVPIFENFNFYTSGHVQKISVSAFFLTVCVQTNKPHKWRSTRRRAWLATKLEWGLTWRHYTRAIRKRERVTKHVAYDVVFSFSDCCRAWAHNCRERVYVGPSTEILAHVWRSLAFALRAWNQNCSGAKNLLTHFHAIGHVDQCWQWRQISHR